MIDLLAFQASDSPLRQISLAFFDSGGHQPEGSRIVTTAVLVGAVILAYVIWRRIGGGASWNRQSGSTVLPREISSILEQAMLLRSRIDMSFSPITTSRQTISCTLFELADTGITLEMPLGVTPSESWMDKLMVCYFRIPRENKPPYFYTFTSSVAGVWKKGDISYVVLSMSRQGRTRPEAQTPAPGAPPQGHQGLPRLARRRGRDVPFRGRPEELARAPGRLHQGGPRGIAGPGPVRRRHQAVL
jgi:hypothetical protein